MTALIVKVCSTFVAKRGGCFLWGRKDIVYWRRGSLEVARKRWPSRIIQCECGQPATRLDHHHPYHQEYTECDACYRQRTTPTTDGKEPTDGRNHNHS